MNPFLKLIYYGLYGLVKLALRVYYRIEPVVGLPDPEPKGPLIVLSNHPNALLDPFLIVSRLKRPVFFLANASLFRHWFADWFLNIFYCIPVERPKDTGGQPLNNADAFKRSREHLLANGALYIAPEGTSEREYRLRPVKTGAARIALDVIAHQPDQAVTFLLGGITYADHPAFRSRVLLRFSTLHITREDLPGPPEEWSTVEWLTALIEQRMQALVLHGTEEEDQELLRLRAMLAPWISGPAWHDRLEGLHSLVHQKDNLASTRREQLANYLAEAGVKRIDPRWLHSQRHAWRSWLLLPVASLILLHHLILFGLPEVLRRMLKAHPVYDATVRYVGGMVAYMVGIPLLWWGMGYLVPSPAWRVAWIAMVVGLGPWAWEQVVHWQADREARIFRRRVTTDWMARFQQWMDPWISGKS